MQQTSSAAGTSPSIFTDAVGSLTAVHLGWIVFFAVLVVVCIAYGIGRRRRLNRAQRDVVEHSAEAGVRPPEVVAEPAVASIPTASDRPEPTRAPAEPDRADRADPAQPNESTPPPPPRAAAPGNDPADGPVTQLKGLGPKVAARLADLGIASIGQIAALDHDAAQALDAQLGAFRGRMERDRWVEQARFLAAGDRAGFEAVFGKL